jgi:hypothetical protein
MSPVADAGSPKPAGAGSNPAHPSFEVDFKFDQRLRPEDIKAIKQGARCYRMQHLCQLLEDQLEEARLLSPTRAQFRAQLGLLLGSLEGLMASLN